MNINFAKAMEGPKDSLRKKYAIDDPRNPDCPCHKYQDKADKEFLKWTESLKQELNKEDQKIARRKSIKFRLKNESKVYRKKLDKNRKQKRYLLNFRRNIDSCGRF